MIESALAGAASSDRHDWRTPPDLFAAVHREFAFTTDAAACDGDLVANWYGPGSPCGITDALVQPWRAEDGPFFLNPPYGRALPQWLRRAQLQAMATRQPVVVLHPARTDTRWWHEVIWPYAAEVRLLRGRVHFLDGTTKQPVHPAFFPSALTVFTNYAPGRPHVWLWEI